MQNRALFSFLLLFIFISFNTNAQIKTKPFSSEPQEFITELTEFLQQSTRTDYIALTEKFQTTWTTYDDTKMGHVIFLANDMVQEKMSLYPYFGNYISALNALDEAQLADSVFLGFHKVLDSLHHRSKQNFRTFTKMAADLFQFNTLHKSKTLEWSIDGKYTFTIENSRPCLVVEKCTLAMDYVKDSTYIYNTSGRYYPLDFKWFGKDGKTDWRRVGYDPDSIYCQLTNYQINTKRPEFEADSAYLFNKLLGQRAMLGKFSDKGIPNLKPARAKFPKFTAYDDAVKIPNFIKGLNYYGRYAIEGRKYYCLATEFEPAQIIFTKENKPIIRSQAKSFAIDDKSVSSQRNQVSILFDEDSIFHSNIKFKFNILSRELNLFRVAKSGFGAAFEDSYHNLDIQCDIISWKIDTPRIDFKMQYGKANNEAFFTSQFYFNEREFNLLKGVTTYHPLVRLYFYSEKNMGGSRLFGASDFAASLGVGLAAARNLFIDLSEQGFIFYDRDNELITVREKTFNYVKAYSKKLDYDAIKMVSKTSSRINNAELNLKTFDLKIKGVPSVLLSDSHYVYVFPKNGELIVQKGLDMELSGRIFAGPLDFNGDGFHFDYSDFGLQMDNVDSLKFRIGTGKYDRNGRENYTYVRTVLQNINGEIQLDDPNNKSGKEVKSEYPIFKTDKESFIYYDFEDIQNGAYTRDTFYFNVDPFTLDSLDYITLNQGLNFDGTLVSGGIFPNFRETVKLQPDLTFGFVTATPPEGFPTYGGKGRYFNTLTLNRRGLFGSSGKLTYLNSVAHSENFVFTPDSAFGLMDDFKVPKGEFKGAKFPKIEGEKLTAKWKPYQDSLSLKVTEKPIDIFDDPLITLNGTLVFQPKGATANGSVFYSKDEIESQLFTMDDKRLLADTATLKIASREHDKYAFYSEGIKVNVDFEAKKGVFKAVGEKSKVELQYNELNSYLKDFFWDLKRQEFVLGDKNSTEAETRFETTNPNRKGLAFEAAYATIDLLKYRLSAFGVKGLEVSDALIVPDGAKLTIEKGAKIDPMENALIVLESDSFRHEIYNAVAEVLDGEKFTGEGYFNYKNLTDSIQKIYFNSIFVNDSGVTVASGSIEDSAFVINPGFIFQGSVNLYGNEETIEMKGLAELTDVPPGVVNSPFRLNSKINSQKPYIEISEMRDRIGVELFAGFFFSNLKRKIYPIFMGRRKSANDYPILSASGLLTYDPLTKTYKMGTKEKVLSDALTGNLVVVEGNDTTATLWGEGKITIAPQLEEIKFLNAGKLTFPLETGIANFKLVSLVDMVLPQSPMKLMTNLVFDYSYNLPEVKNNRPEVKFAINNLFEPKIAQTVNDELELYSVFPNNENTQFSFVFTELELEYDNNFKSLKSLGKIGVANINGEVINKKMDGIVEIIGSGEETSLSILIKPNKETYYFFEYTRGDVGMVSSEIEFNDEIIKKLEKKEKGVKYSNTFSLGLTQNKELLEDRVK